MMLLDRLFRSRRKAALNSYTNETMKSDYQHMLYEIVGIYDIM